MRLLKLALLWVGIVLGTNAMAQVASPAAPAPDPQNILHLSISTGGEVAIALRPDKAPGSVARIKALTRSGFYDGLLFHRVIGGFMIQGGDPQSKNAAPGAMLGNGDVGYTIPAEFDSTLFHKKGALAAARTNNPEKASSGCQFYIVQGKQYSDMELNGLEMQVGFKFSPEKRMAYKTAGGTPFLDMNYTVFGEVESGLEVIDKIASLQKDQNNRPLTDFRMKIDILN